MIIRPRTTLRDPPSLIPPMVIAAVGPWRYGSWSAAFDEIWGSLSDGCHAVTVSVSGVVWSHRNLEVHREGAAILQKGGRCKSKLVENILLHSWREHQ